MQDDSKGDSITTDDTVLALYLVQTKIMAELVHAGVIDGKGFAESLDEIAEALPTLTEGSKKILESFKVVAIRVADEKAKN